ncbi:gluconate 2-dehydrogenase subunit 3 family protein [Flavobacterium salmonis]|uniref:Gluconate 2-dehydrogenase subunit 3 n=1 Tax=Flavobacterium salmonis TaxID=2654844 RepID=A0A6V6Z6K8_9FLAO|nr:gluconate 2-dehydrogenase subunit 3 family protein [Flavobacterium salmonis]CAD0007275.1 hypothetical protein FLAT13_03755 [Flavobacterium salmonis]
MMNRRKAIGGMLALTGISIASYSGFKFFYENTKSDKGQLHNYLSLISELVDILLPRTQTPGAKEAKVQDYIISYMESCSSNKEYNNFLNGLKDLQETCLSTYDTTFEKCTMQQKTEIVQTFENNADSGGLLSKISNKINGRSFYTILKKVTIEGYCTSQMGATQLLNYELIPGRYNAITTIKPNQKAWATK